MNRVRIVAVTAVALGGAVFIGTQFQESLGLAPVGEELASMQMETGERVFADGRVEGQIITAGAAPSPAVSLVPGEDPAPALSSASIVPGVSAVPVDDEDKAPELVAAEEALMEILAADNPAAPFAPAQAVAQNEQTPVAPLDEEMQAELSACAVWLVVTPSVGAMLDVSVYAPCDRDAAVQVSHAGLTFDTSVGADGQLTQMVPALTADATVTVTFADGREQSDSTVIGDLASIERVALQWDSPSSLLLHAYEFGAEYGQTGHIHVANPLAPGVDGHGFLTVLGDPMIPGARMAQVYSYPSGQMSRTGSVTLEIEAPVTDLSCGRPLSAQAIELRGDGIAQIRMIELAMPECDGAGGYVVMPGVLPDIQIASLN